MNPSALNEKVNAILQITEQMLTVVGGNDWEKAIELQTLLNTELQSLFSQPIAEQDAGIVRDMIEKVMETEQQIKQSAQAAKVTIHSASKKMSNEKAALAAYTRSIE